MRGEAGPLPAPRPPGPGTGLPILAEHGDHDAVLAGGQSLIPLMNLRLTRPEVVVDVNRVPGLDGITVEEDRVRLGALASAADVERGPRVGGALPALPAVPRALRYVGHPQIRNRSTVEGNVAHVDPASELPAVRAALDGWMTLGGCGACTVPVDEVAVRSCLPGHLCRCTGYGDVRAAVREAWTHLRGTA